ncbi:uncharacterized protein LOC108994837 isoform X2 [Juglans regia]|uniref:Uncharacterized protein LOC108994837 isoform X2 n=1 Tax=Juglans regia TaxID=51240 RepID=A0A2I4F299_JUGRE|nr:uncharacterized protein LOC108994837 isoform X2 [Juglans regia]
MNEDAKRIIPGGLLIKSPISDDLIPSSVAATPLPDKRVIIKSADMLPDVQKEAIDTAIAVSSSLILNFIYLNLRHLRSTVWRRTLRSTLRRSSTSGTAPPGTASLVVTLVPM